MDNGVERDKRMEEIMNAKRLADKKFEYITDDYQEADRMIEFLLEEIDRLKLDKQKLHNVHDAQYSRACQLQQEIEQCNEEYQTHMSEMQQEISCLQVERDKAIAERDELLYELREAKERGSLD